MQVQKEPPLRNEPTLRLSNGCCDVLGVSNQSSETSLHYKPEANWADCCTVNLVTIKARLYSTDDSPIE